MCTYVNRDWELTEDRLSRLSQIPSPQPRVNANADDGVTLSGVPVDICDSPVMCLQDVFDRRLPDE